MNKIYFAISLLIISAISCTKDNNAITIVTEEIERGAVLRTLDVTNSTFNINDLSSTFSVTLQEQDIEEGAIFDFVDVTVRFLDNTPENGVHTTNAITLESVPSADFDFSGELPVITASFSFEELLTATGIAQTDVAVKDQFILDLSLHLTDGRIFNESNASSIILAFDTFFSSPFTYTITVVEPIQADAFTGLYAIESILDGPNGPTFVDENRIPLQEGDLIEIVAREDVNVRSFKAHHNLFHVGLEAPRDWVFTIAGNTSVMTKHQLSSPEGYCIFNAAPILLGPGQENGPANAIDDSVFELWFVEGYLGFDGSCDFETAPSRYRFAKQ